HSCLNPDGGAAARIGNGKVLLALGAVNLARMNLMTPRRSPNKSWQPDGRVNAAAHPLAREVHLEREISTTRAKAFNRMALLSHVPAITPRVVDNTALTFRQAA